ncbi:uncharacterized protein EKO05_0011023 [Ascochyta rabiei]|uniref:uncharacterized protein n=1 Tax=Didymella rabiei TaxID=5454 RepID=UPI0022080EAB|nr:uncharacterized protein EKO05_0011023 [Ascochyta rabiei]UPX20804.1 hypothetical protein EKO05_0011023 [Ascochyta rabiei]
MTGPALFRSNTQHPRPLGRGVLRAMQPLSITRCTLASASRTWRWCGWVVADFSSTSGTRFAVRAKQQLHRRPLTGNGSRAKESLCPLIPSSSC